tara:strand:- start:457 stop:609 length:153 start_codon:yes stop_codon:yes gene_type:complete
MIIGGQRVYLGLARQPSEGAGEDNLVMIAQKGGAAAFILGAASAQSGLVE